VIAGAVVIALGIRGRAVFASPRCAKCSYDLRAVNFLTQQVGSCPECGADLGQPAAVTFGQLQRRPSMIIAGVIIALSPLLLMVLLVMVPRAVIRPAVGAQASKARTTPALITSLATTLNQPWDWQELERRLGAGSLTTADVDAVVNVLINDIAAKRAAGQRPQPVHWAERFLKPAVSSGALSPAVLKSLCQTYYGDAPQIRSRSRVRQNQPMDLEFDLEGPWNLPGMQVCWSLKQVQADDGSVLTLTHAYDQRSATARSNPDRFSGTNRGGDVRAQLAQALSPGEHELSFTFDMGTVVENTTFVGLDGNPGTADKWPSPISTWQSIVKQKVQVVTQDQSVIDVITDPKQDPLQKVTLNVEQALTRPHTRGVEIVIKWAASDHADPPISYRVTLVAGDQKIDFGRVFTGRTGTSRSTSSMSGMKMVKTLAPEVKSIDLLFTPDPEGAERFVGVERIWGGEYKIENVKLERYELEEDK
jgi:hypothetical protein